MPPPKKAAKKTAKKAAKKAAKHADPKHKETKDLRRSFEHLGRIESLQSAVQAGSQADVSSLVSLAQQQLGAGQPGNAADLLRAAEHLSFAALATGHTKQGKVSAAVHAAIEEEYDRLRRKAGEHWEGDADRDPTVASLYKSSRQGAKRAFGAANYRQALELIRACEAIAHVVRHGPEKLTAGRAALALTSSGR
jgi:hypothetical protein